MALNELPHIPFVSFELWVRLVPGGWIWVDVTKVPKEKRELRQHIKTAKWNTYTPESRK
jgi:hypothetical protein